MPFKTLEVDVLKIDGVETPFFRKPRLEWGLQEVENHPYRKWGPGPGQITGSFRFPRPLALNSQVTIEGTRLADGDSLRFQALLTRMERWLVIPLKGIFPPEEESLLSFDGNLISFDGQIFEFIEQEGWKLSGDQPRHFYQSIGPAICTVGNSQEVDEPIMVFGRG